MVLHIHLVAYPTTRCQGTVRRGFSQHGHVAGGIYCICLLLDMAVFVFRASIVVLVVDAITILLMLIHTTPTLTL
jgi:hypothetical protein